MSFILNDHIWKCMVFIVLFCGSFIKVDMLSLRGVYGKVAAMKRWGTAAWFKSATQFLAGV